MFESKQKISSLTCTLTKRPLGHILLDGEFVASEDLKRALEDQIQSNHLLGEILVRMGVIDKVDLDVALSIQKDLVSLKDAIKLAAGVQQLLGDLLIQARRINPEQLGHALKEQQRTGEKLGRIFVRRGIISKQELEGLLAFQQHQGDPKRAIRLRLGQLLVDTKKITREQLQHALRTQLVSPHMKLGEVLVEEGYVTHEEISHGLKLQHKLLTAALVAIMSLCAPASPFTEHARAHSSHGQESVVETAARPRLERDDYTGFDLKRIRVVLSGYAYSKDLTYLVETMAERIAEILLGEFKVPWCRLRSNKKGAVRYVRDVGVIIERGRRPAAG